MDSILNFLADNYIWFMIGGVVLLFALIGFVIDDKKKNKNENQSVETPVTNTATVNQVPLNQESNVVSNETPAPTVMPSEEGVQDFTPSEPTLTFDTPANEVNEPVISETTNLNGDSKIGEPITFETPSTTVSEVEPVQAVETPVVSAVEPSFNEMPSEPAPLEFQTANANVNENENVVTQNAEPVINTAAVEPQVQTPVVEPVVMPAPSLDQVNTVPTQNVKEPDLIEIPSTPNTTENTTNTTPLV